MRSVIVAGALGLVLATTGCQTLSTFHTARPVPAGTGEWALTGTAMRRPGSDTVTLTPAVRYRRGIVSRVDVGVNALMLDTTLPEGRTLLAAGGAVDVNVLLVDLGLMAFSVDPQLAGTWFFGADRGFTGTAQLNLLADLLSTPVFTLTAGLRPGWAFTVTDADWHGRLIDGPLAGAMVGAKASLLGVSVMPEVSITYGLGGRETLYAAGVALMF